MPVTLYLNRGTDPLSGTGHGTAEWVGGLNDRMHAKLAKAGLVTERAKTAAIEAAKLGPFLDAYIESRDDVKDTTATVYGHTRRCLINLFGADKPMASVTKGDAIDFRRYLGRPKAKKGEGLSENTVRRRCAIAKQYFQAAVDKKLIDGNPFAEMKKLSVRGNDARQFFVTPEMAQRVLDVCPDCQWRLIFALSRFGGLRCPSEHLALRWGDVDWERNRMTVHSPKTERYEGKETRVIPLFAEIRQALEDVFEQAEVGTEFVITRYRQQSCNLRTQLRRVIRKAGLEPWPKLFHNLRATRQTELANEFPQHVVCDWLGNSETVAMEHYFQTTEDHFERAVRGKSVAHSVARPDGMELTGDEWEGSDNPKSNKIDTSQGFSTPVMGGTGLEPVTSTV